MESQQAGASLEQGLLQNMSGGAVALPEVSVSSRGKGTVLAARYVRCLSRKAVAVGVCLAFAALTCTAGLLGPKFLTETSITLSAPEGSRSAQANEVVVSHFPQIAKQSDIIVMIDAGASSSTSNRPVVVCNATRDFLASLGTSIRKEHSQIVQKFTTYFKLRNSGQDFAANQLVHENTMIAELGIDSIHASQGEVRNFVRWLVQAVDTGSTSYLEPVGLRARATGINVFLEDILSGTERDLAVMDLGAFPIALLILTWVLRSTRLLVLPIMCLVITLLTAFLVMRYVAVRISVASFAPSVMASLSVALSIDYSLFLLSRFREELINGSSVPEAVVRMLSNAGHVIIVSGLTLTMCFLGNLFFPTAFLNTIGIAAATTCLCALFSNLLLVPTLLLHCSCFKRAVEPWKCPAFCSSNKNAEATQSTWWDRHSARVARWWRTIIVVFTIIVAPFATRIAMGFHYSSSLLQLTPRGAASTDTYLKLGQVFGDGLTIPFQIIVVPPQGEPTLNGVGTIAREACNVSRTLLSDYVQVADASVGVNISSLSYVTSLGVDLCAPYSGLDQDPASLCAELCWSDPSNCMGSLRTQCLELQSLYQRYNLSSSALLAQAVISVAPMDPAGGVWIVAARKALDLARQEIPGASGYRFYLASAAVTNYDSVVQVYAVFPYAIAIVTVLVFLLVGFAFKSAVIPLRSILSIAATVSLVYGSAIFIFEDGALEWIGFSGLSRAPGQNAMCWLAPVLMFSIVVGLGLDCECRGAPFQCSSLAPFDLLLLPPHVHALTHSPALLFLFFFYFYFFKRRYLSPRSHPRVPPFGDE